MKRINDSYTSMQLSHFFKTTVCQFKSYVIIFFLLLTILPGIKSFAQQVPEYDEISLFLDVPDLGGREMDVLIKGQEVFLPVTGIFDFFKIRNVPSPGLDTITGFFINQEATFFIDRANNFIQYGKEEFKLEEGNLIMTETNLYLSGKYFGEIFGLECIFSFRNMSVTVNTKLELPAIREMRLEKMRKNLNHVTGEVKADTVIGRRYPMFHFGMADWSANFTEIVNGPTDARLNLALGSIIAGGEATVSLNYFSNEPFTEKQQHYLWRYVNNDNRALRQVMAGKIAAQATSSIYDPVVGVKLTNTSTNFRKSYGSYTLSDRTEPDWIVELYVNNVLVDYVKADASGFFTFEVPLVYGNTAVKLKFHGPWGEERTREQHFSIPFNFVPKNTLEYTVSAGMVEDSTHSRFSRTSLNYGLTRGITIGTGFEYLSSVASGPSMPYINGSFRLASNLLLSGEHTHTVRSRGTLSYRLASDIQFDLDYIKYEKDQKAINNNYLEERKVSLAMPIRLKHFAAYNRLSVSQLVLPTSDYTTAEWLISGNLYGVNTNVTSYALFIGETSPYIYTDLALSFRLPANLLLKTQGQYGYIDKKILSTRLGLEKRLKRGGYFTISYEQNFKSNRRMLEFGFRYDFKFAQTSFSARQSNDITRLIQYARGSFINDSQTNYLSTDKIGNVGKGGITVLPFLDINFNNKMDPGEPKVYGLNLRASAGRIEKSEKDSTIRILGLEAYTDCFIELDPGSFDNIAWRLKNLSMKVAVNPNMVTLVEIPIQVVGEAAGTVWYERKGMKSGLGRIIVNFYNMDQKKVGRTLTETDGYFSYFSLAPGAYHVKLDTNQLKKLGMTYSPEYIDCYINESTEGDYVDGLDFTVIKKKVEAEPVIETELAIGLDPMERKTDSGFFVIHEIYEEISPTTIGSNAIQVGAFKDKDNAIGLMTKIEGLVDKKVEIFVKDGFFKVQIIGFTSREEVDKTIPLLIRNDINKIRVVNFSGLDTQLVLSNRPSIAGVVEKYTEKDTSYFIIHEVEGILPSQNIDVAIQLGAFHIKSNALGLREKLSGLLDKEVIIFEQDGYDKVRITDFESREAIDAYIPVLIRNGITEIWITSDKDPSIETASEDPITEEVTRITRNDSTFYMIQRVVKNVSTSTIDTNTFILMADNVIEEKKVQPILLEQEELDEEIVIDEEIVFEGETYVQKEIKVEKPEDEKEEVAVGHQPFEAEKTLEEKLLEAEYRYGPYDSPWPKVEFTVQVAASKTISDPAVIERKFGLNRGVDVKQIDGMYRFSVGRYIKFWRAIEYRNILITRNGIEDAFVVAYKEGKKIMLHDLILEHNIPDAQTRPAYNRAFSVQVLATKDANIPSSEIREMYQTDYEIFKEYDERDGMYRYSIGNFNSYNEAAKLRNQLKARGFRGHFIIGFKEGKRVQDLKSIID